MTKSTSLNLYLRARLLVFLFLSLLVAGCAPKEPPMPTELILYNWVDYMPQSVMDAVRKGVRHHS